MDGYREVFERMAQQANISLSRRGCLPEMLTSLTQRPNFQLVDSLLALQMTRSNRMLLTIRTEQTPNVARFSAIRAEHGEYLQPLVIQTLIHLVTRVPTAQRPPSTGLLLLTLTTSTLKRVKGRLVIYLVTQGKGTELVMVNMEECPILRPP